MEKTSIKQFALYTVIGITSTAVQMAAYWAVLAVSEKSYHLANLAGFLVSVFYSFYWNQRFVFRREQGEKRTFWKALLKTYAMYAGTGVVLASILLHILIEWLHMSRYFAPVLIVVILYPVNFLVSKFWAYRTEK